MIADAGATVTVWLAAVGGRTVADDQGHGVRARSRVGMDRALRCARRAVPEAPLPTVRGPRRRVGELNRLPGRR